MYRKVNNDVFLVSAGIPMAVYHEKSMCTCCGMNHQQCTVAIHTHSALVVPNDFMSVSTIVPVAEWGHYDSLYRDGRFAIIHNARVGYIAIHRTKMNGTLFYSKDDGFAKRPPSIFTSRDSVRPIVNSIHPGWSFTVVEVLYFV